jgi:uncharacterized protein YlxW (UPF0749 family)
VGHKNAISTSGRYAREVLLPILYAVAAVFLDLFLPRSGDERTRGAELLALRQEVRVLQRRLEQLEAQLEALDASFVRHQGQNEDDFRRAEQSVDRVGDDLSHHLDAHWRSR